MEHAERRHFHRVALYIDAVLIDPAGVATHGHLRDISLQGALFEADDACRADIGAHRELRMELSPEVVIRMQGSVAHERDDCIGLHCDEIDLDSITALRRLIVLNAGDPELLERELGALTTR